ncbi:MAG: hypothetical protein LUD72_12325 [Bacteroidales bacterium]|nr:hypothetical protein [Bacteroidales bacterium]
MDIYRFFNSKDIAEHLKSTDYEFTLPEAAYVIYQSKYATLDERIDAWQELIDTMPDCSFEIGDDREKIESFHAFLREYSNLQKKMVNLFSDSKDSVYTYELYGREPFSVDDRYENENMCFCDQGAYFGTAEMAFANYQENLRWYQADGFCCARFHKYSLVTEPKNNILPEMCLETDLQMQVLSVTEFIDPWFEAVGSFLNYREGELIRTFKRMNFHFPIPFHRGDILFNRVTEMDPNSDHGPFVFSRLSSRNMDYLAYYLIEEKSRATLVDVRDKDIARQMGLIDSYLNLERYDGPLHGVYRALKPVSQMMTANPETGNPMISEELGINAYHQILAEEMCKNGRADFEAMNNDKRLELVGLKRSMKKNYYLP